MLLMVRVVRVRGYRQAWSSPLCHLLPHDLRNLKLNLVLTFRVIVFSTDTFV
jgi:hypothetical protein